MSVSRFLTYLGFAVWVSVCAAAPEFIWQGLLALAGHFSWQNVYAIVLIGLILTVFVEPILERAREGRWTPEHRNTRSLLFTAPIAFTFGVVAVGLHECMTAYLGSGHGEANEGVAKAVRLILEWASIPLAVTLAWFAARLEGKLPMIAAAVASIWIVGMGWVFKWGLHDIVMTAIPCIALVPLGQHYIRRNWHEDTFRNLAFGLAGVTGAWLLLTLLFETLFPTTNLPGYSFTDPTELADDFRFYLGWAIGLVLAPNPVPLDDHRRGALPAAE